MIVAVALAASIVGITVDAQTGLPLPAATVALAGRATSTITGDAGRFVLPDLPPGRYRLEASREGYQPVQSGELRLDAGQTASVTLALQRAQTGAPLKVVGATTVIGAAALERTGVISRLLSTEVLAQSGIYRAADALRELPALSNSIKGDTAAFGDDVPLDIRGIGALETVAVLDGHPIGLGFPGGFNYQTSPVVGMRDVAVTYGSGSNLLGESAIGGIVDFQTLDPTPQARFAYTQGFGTFGALASNARATGTVGRLGYALAYGVDGIDGPLKNASFYQVGAAYDQSATDPATRALAVYPDDSGVVSRTGLVKLRYALSPASALTFTGLATSYWENKTGNGDGDYLDYGPALAIGNNLLAKYNPASYPLLAPCPAGSFVASNAIGIPNGSGPGGKPDGGSACQTPQQYAANNSGWDGVGPAWQSFVLDDAHLGFVTAAHNRVLRIDAFADSYREASDRTFALPDLGVPGVSPLRSAASRKEVETGITVSEETIGRNDALTVGATYLNVAYDLAATTYAGTAPGGAPILKTAIGAPIAHRSGFFAHEAYRVADSPLSIYADALFQYASATGSRYLDPRATNVYAPGARQAFRLSAGETTTQPAGNQLGQPFVPHLPGGAGGGAAITCAGLNSIGTTPSTVLKPERGVDEEFAYDRTFGGDSQAQLALYNVNVLDKLYSTLVPLTSTGAGFIDPAFLAAATQAVQASCGAAAASLLGLTGTFNVGTLRARGIALSGRQRLTRATFLDYDWSLDSTVLVSAPAPLLQSNLTLVPGSQLPSVPLHTLGAALEHVFPRGFDVRYGFHAVSANNTKNLPPYDFSDLRIGIPVRSAQLAVSIANLFNQYAFIQGYRYEGVPVALNAYATAASYAPVIGASATERFGLPARTLFLTLTLNR